MPCSLVFDKLQTCILKLSSLIFKIQNNQPWNVKTVINPYEQDYFIALPCATSDTVKQNNCKEYSLRY